MSGWASLSTNTAKYKPPSQMVSEFTTSMPGSAHSGRLSWNDQAECLLEGAATLRDINRYLGLSFPVDGSKTLNGMVLEVVRDIPEPIPV
jgi:Mg2+/Co2+ transporter CorB